MRGCGRSGTSPVASRPAGDTPEEVSDLAGNVWEYVADPFDRKTPAHRTMKGGGFDAAVGLLKSWSRYPIAPDQRNLPFVGFRCARSRP
jgi:formylglycine-generating enzyme required for sulfatase activity